MKAYCEANKELRRAYSKAHYEANKEHKIATIRLEQPSGSPSNKLGLTMQPQLNTQPLN
jgi:hypothetical protein